VTTWTVFHTGTPALPNETDGPIAVSTGFTINDGGTYWCIGVEFYAATSAPTGVSVALWERNTDESFGATPGALLASEPAPGAITPGVRNQIMFDTAVQVTAALFPNGLYATMRTGNNYVATGGTFSGGSLVNGPITAYQAGSPGANGRFKVTPAPTGAADSYPNTQFGGNGYWVSPIITDVDPGGGTNVEVTDTPGPALAGGAPDAAAAGVVVVDQRGPALGGGTPAAAEVGVQVNDSAGPALAGGTPSGLAGDLFVTDTPGGVLAGGSPASVATGESVEIVDRPAPALAGGSPADVTLSTTEPDTAVWPLLQAALVCLQTQMAGVESPPMYVQLRPGVAFTAGLSQVQDECCQGSAWIRVVNITPTDNFPEVASAAGNCSPMALAVELELGTLRCAPTRSNLVEGEIVTATQWSDTVRLIMNDAAALRRTACCIAALVDNYVIGQWTPQQVEANCAGGTMTMTIQAPACDFTCG
jgi:hypothetical protein